MKTINKVKEVESLIVKLCKDNSTQVPKYLYWLLTDQKYGAINQTKDEKSIKSIQSVIDLFEEWFRTGLKPDRNLWNDLKNRNDDNNIATIDFYINNVINYIISYVTSYNIYYYSAAQSSIYIIWAADENSISREESRQAQINKLKELMSGELYTFADYEKDAKSFD